MEIETSSEFLLDYPEIQIELIGGMMVDVYIQDEKIKIDDENVEYTLTLVYGLTIANTKYLHIRFESEEIFDVI
ncbi:hypothetical protein MXB_2998 [Myxobolus squamalis]|nr:hypothetical protein MXB_2998 [Myxobolus squamalis]